MTDHMHAFAIPDPGESCVRCVSAIDGGRVAVAICECGLALCGPCLEPNNNGGDAMADYRTMFDSDWIRAWDLGGKDRVVTIVKVEAGELENHRAKKKDRKPVVWFKGAKKPLALNKTNAKTIASMYGTDTTSWVGKTIAIYPTKTQFGNEEMDCIRVRPNVPKGKAEDMPNPEPPQSAGREPGSDDDKEAA